MRTLLLIAVLFLSGCGAPYWVRRAVVHDDWVYIKKNRTLYRRYIPRGVRLVGNPNMLAVHTNIRRWSADIVVYGDWGAARAAHPEAAIDEASRRHIPCVED